jgi:hypothetical protein
VRNSVSCDTPLKPTLVYLNAHGFADEPPKPYPPPYNHNGRPECVGCPYPRVGVFCYGADGACVKSDYSKAVDESRNAHQPL